MEVKLARIRKGFNQDYLCKLVGISKTTLVNIEKGNYDIRKSLMEKIAEALDTDIRVLFFNE